MELLLENGADVNIADEVMLYDVNVCISYVKSLVVGCHRPVTLVYISCCSMIARGILQEYTIIVFSVSYILYYYIWKNHFPEMKGEVGMSPHEKQRE